MAPGRARLAGVALLGCVCFIAYQSLAAGGAWRCDGLLLLSRPLDLLDFALLFGWFGVAVTTAARWHDRDAARRARRWWPILAVVATVAFEVAQTGIAGRGPDVSPPLLTALAVLATTAILSDQR